MAEQIKIFEELAKAKYKARLHLLEEKARARLRMNLFTKKCPLGKADMFCLSRARQQQAQ